MQNQFEFLLNESAPKVLVEALKLYDTKEFIGDKNNPVILDWVSELGLSKVYNSDSIPWCGLYIAIVCKRAGKPVVENPLWARNWSKWGTKVDTAMLGDILVFSRGNSGHVGLYVAEDTTRYYVLGGNQGDEVNISPILKSRCIGIRRTTWSIAEPANVRQIFIKNSGIKLSINER
jgi:uncharacterized protein (TIGR02594 family)